MKKVKVSVKCAWIQCNDIATVNGFCQSHNQKMFYFDDKYEEDDEIRRLKGESGIYYLIFKNRIYIGKADKQQFHKRNYDERNALITCNYANLKSKKFHKLFNEYGRKACGADWDSEDKKVRHEVRGKYFDNNVTIKYHPIPFFQRQNGQLLSFEEHRKHSEPFQIKRYDNDRTNKEKRVHMSKDMQMASNNITSLIGKEERKRIQYLYDYDKDKAENAKIMLNENTDGIIK